MPELILAKLFEDYKKGDQDPFEGGLLVSRLIEDNLNITWIYDQLSAVSYTHLTLPTIYSV